MAHISLGHDSSYLRFLRIEIRNPENVNYSQKTNIIRQTFLCLRHASDSKISQLQITPARIERPAEDVEK